LTFPPFLLRENWNQSRSSAALTTGVSKKSISRHRYAEQHAL
jgi:hypothetical protein